MKYKDDYMGMMACCSIKGIESISIEDIRTTIIRIL